VKIMSSNRIYAARETLEASTMNAVAGVMERASWAGCRSVGARLGLLFFHALRKRRGTAIGNIQRAFPSMSEVEAREIARRSCQNFAMTFCEFLHLRTASFDEVQSYCDIEGGEYIQTSRESGRGVILMTAHLGNWEVMGGRASHDFPLTVIARPTGNPRIEAHIASVRHAAGFKVISKNDTGKAALRVLRENGTLGILPDQYATDDGVLLPFFGHTTRVVPAVARLAMISGAPVVPAFGVRQTPWLKNGRIIAKVAPSWTVPRAERTERNEAIINGTRRMIEEMEAVIRAHPDQWLWVHRRWRAEDDGVEELIANLKEQGVYPSFGTGTDTHVLDILHLGHKALATRLYMEIHRVPYKEAARAVRDLA
jgi:KDO2-lipid IV(A) lauroyltransferase